MSLVRVSVLFWMSQSMLMASPALAPAPASAPALDELAAAAAASSCGFVPEEAPPPSVFCFLFASGFVS